MEENQTVLSKETRKIRKVKKFFGDEESTENKSMKKKKSTKKTVINKEKNNINKKEEPNTSPIPTQLIPVSSSHLDSTSSPQPDPTSPQPSIIKNKNKVKQKQKKIERQKQDDDSNNSDSVEKNKKETTNNTSKEMDTKKEENANYDSIDEYNTDELIEKAGTKMPRLFKKDKHRKLNKVKPNKINTMNTETSVKSIKRSRVKKVIDEVPTYDHERVQYLAENYKDEYWKFHLDNSPNMIGWVNEDFPLKIETSLDHIHGPVLGMTLSEDGSALATFSIFGSISIWDIINKDFKLVRRLRDTDETQIEEFYCGTFKGMLLATAGKLKDRHRWSNDDNDNHILPCPIKIFDTLSCKVIARLEGHDEEILCIKTINFDNENYYITTSQDGYIMKWHMDSDWITLKERKTMGDGVTCMAFTVNFLPNTGNKYFLGACDGHIKLYDFEKAQLMQVFEDIYSSYCDCGKFIKWIDEDEFLKNTTKYSDQKKANNENKDNIDQEKEVKKDKEKEKEKYVEPIVNIDEDEDEDVKMIDVLDDDQQYAWFISRGAEWCDVSEGISSIPNTCTLHRLIYPKKSGNPFKLEEIKRYKDKDFSANSWLVKIASNGRYIFAPTVNGQFFIFNILTGQVTGIIKEHEDIEVRDIVVHPYFPLLFSSGDDGRVYVYSYKE